MEDSPGKNAQTETCVICMDIPSSEVFLSQCRHIFCLECIVTWSFFGIHVVPSDTYYTRLTSPEPKCPMCKQCFNLTVGQSLETQFLAVKAYAQITCFGCKQSFEAKEIIEHCLQCPKVFSKCPTCDQAFKIGHYNDHVQTDCTHIPCLCCDMHSSWSKLQIHRSIYLVAAVNVSSIDNFNKLIMDVRNQMMTPSQLEHLYLMFRRIKTLSELKFSGDQATNSQSMPSMQYIQRSVADIQSSFVYTESQRPSVESGWTAIDRDLRIL